MLPTSAGVEPVTSWSPVGRRFQQSHRGRLWWSTFQITLISDYNRKQLNLTVSSSWYLQSTLLKQIPGKLEKNRNNNGGHSRY